MNTTFLKLISLSDRRPNNASRLNKEAFVAAFLITTSALPAAEIPFPNGGFEERRPVTVGNLDSFGVDSQSAPEWRLFAVNGATGRFAISSTIGAAEGSNALIIERGAGEEGDSAADDSSPVAVQNGHVYKVLAQAKSVGVPPPGESLSAGITARVFDADGDFRQQTFIFRPDRAYGTVGAAIYAENGFSLLSVRLDTAGKASKVVFDKVRYEDVTTGKNRLINGGFENSAEQLTGWAFGEAEGGDGSAVLEKGAGVQRSNACLFTRLNATGDVVFHLLEGQAVPVRQKDSLNVSFKARKPDNNGCALRVTLLERDNSSVIINETTFMCNPSGRDFVPFTRKVTTVANAVSLEVDFRISTLDGATPAAGSFYLDDVSVQDGPSS